ncbi:hypothetical protein ZEAMMB73_Zm00001d019587 [Zea mays]|uniref:Uncharacterized protein n=1 Tax=Zea mays TaxID=4577 RepID=A0A1D6HZ16_MAIZE|nr:hypothetical protein ZEAMMB73_Zm00001d019587 [Zea mays]ONM53333.1 hypothetical protein ZEAMMB73_Zm00001d019587 [Zea mays]
MEEVQNCVMKLRSNPRRHRDKVYVGCGAGFGGDRLMAAYKLLQRVKELNYLVLECLAERTLADRYRIMVSGGKGYDPRVKEWMSLLLPLAFERKVCIITNMGAMDPLGAQKEVLNLASVLGLEITVAVAYESSFETQGSPVLSDESTGGRGIYELGWNWNDTQLAQGTLASHLLECGCQLTGGYFMHPGDAYRDFPFEQLLDLSLPFAEVSCRGEVIVSKVDGSGGLLSPHTCAEQLLYEVGDPANYITPDMVVDFCNVQFHQISKDKVSCDGAKPSNACCPEKLLQLSPTESGWKGWGEISYGGHQCLKRAQAAEYLVRSWIGERYPGINEKIVSYVMGYDSLKAIGGDEDSYLAKQVLDHWTQEGNYSAKDAGQARISQAQRNPTCRTMAIQHFEASTETPASPAPALPGKRVALYHVAHSRAGDKGNDMNFSVIPHSPADIGRLRSVITPDWVKNAVSPLLGSSSFPDERDVQHRNKLLELVTVEIYYVPGISSLNVVIFGSESGSEAEPITA